MLLLEHFKAVTFKESYLQASLLGTDVFNTKICIALLLAELLRPGL